MSLASDMLADIAAATESVAVVGFRGDSPGGWFASCKLNGELVEAYSASLDGAVAELRIVVRRWRAAQRVADSGRCAHSAGRHNNGED